MLREGAGRGRGADGQVLELPPLPALPGARSLSLRDNQLLSMAPAAFMNLPGLSELDLSHNRLTGASPSAPRSPRSPAAASP